jgi:hypothetical protein
VGTFGRGSRAGATTGSATAALGGKGLGFDGGAAVTVLAARGAAGAGWWQRVDDRQASAMSA